MYPVSDIYKQTVTSYDVNWQIRLQIQTAFSTYEILGEDIIENSFKVAESVSGGSTITLGSVCASDLEVSIRDIDGRFKDVQLNGAIIRPYVGLKLSDDNIEWVPMGVFIVDTVESAIKTPSRPFDVLKLKAADNIVRLNRPFSGVNISFPCTAKILLTAVCQHCNIPLSPKTIISFLHDNYVINSPPDGDITCMDVISYIAELACSWAKCDRYGQLELKWFTNPGYIQEAVIDGNVDHIDGGNFSWWNNHTYDGGVFKADEPDAVLDTMNMFDLSIDDDPIYITGVSLETDDQTLIAGTDRYIISITDNPLIQDNAEEVLENIYERLHGFTFIPFTSNRRSDPAMQAGDLVELIDIDGRRYRTIITDYTYVFGGKSQMKAVGASETTAGHKSTLDKKISQLRRKIHEKQVQLDALDQAILNATSLIAGALGGYAIKGEGQYEGNIFIADNQDLSKAKKVWRWNINGFGYSENGINGPYTTAITADGSIIAAMITANMIRTGLLQSLNGESWIDLDTGAFSMGNGALKWDKTNGFEAVSAKRITKPGSDTYGVIGDFLNENGQYYWEGFKLVSSQGDFFRVTSPYTGSFLIYNGQYPVLISYPDSGLVHLIRKKTIDVVKGNDSETILQYQDENNSFKNARVICDANGVKFEKNGLPHGGTRSIRVSTPDGIKYLNFENGIFTNVTDS